MWIAWLFAFGGVAHADQPNPDRPSVSRSGYLIGAGTAELELGVGVGSGGALSVPFTLKAAAPQRLELRISGDAFGVGASAPALVVGSKLGLVDTDDVGIALYLDSALPLGVEVWSANAHGLGTFTVGPMGVQVNAGVTFGPGPGVVGAPFAIALSPPPAGVVSTFLEYAAVLSGGLGGHTLTAGGSFLARDNVMFDAGISYFADSRTLAGTVGGTVNFGGRG